MATEQVGTERPSSHNLPPSSEVQVIFGLHEKQKRAYISSDQAPFCKNIALCLDASCWYKYFAFEHP